MTPNKSAPQILSYGGGRQTVAMCILVAGGILPKPDRLIIADTGREKSSTWAYLDEVMQPLLSKVGLRVEIAPRSLSYVDLYAHNGDLLLPVYTPTGKLSTFCASEWKKYVIRRYLRQKHGIRAATLWIGYAIDEARRYKRTQEDVSGPWYRRFPLFELHLTKTDCQTIITEAGLPLPEPSSCWMCPNMPNEQWRQVRDDFPADFEQACQLDEQVRAENVERGNGDIWLHHSRVPLREADLNAPDRQPPARQCGLGLCMV